MAKRTLVIGASEHSYRYSFMAINKLSANGHLVFALGAHPGKVGKIEIVDKPANWEPIDTVSVYLNPYNQQGYYRYLVELHPNRVIFNPGSENDELALLLNQNGIATIYACTLVLLSTGQF